MSDTKQREFPGQGVQCPCWALNETVPEDAGESPVCPPDCERPNEKQQE